MKQNTAGALEEAPATPARRGVRVLALPLSFGALLAGTASFALSANATAATPAKKHHAKAARLTVHESLVVVDGGMYGHPGSPEFVGSSKIDFPANARVDLTIYNFDDGPAPLPKGLPYDKVMGTVGGTATYDGHTITSVSNKVISHTFTVPGIGLNIPLPAAQSTKKGALTPAVVEASFVTSKKGSFTWQCYAPCGSGKSGMGGAMKDPGEMTGTVKIG